MKFAFCTCRFADRSKILATAVNQEMVDIKMGANDVLLLKEMVDRSRLETDGLNAAEQEAYFASSHYLNSYLPSHDDVLSGIVDGTRDGGIDAVHIFANGYCLRDEFSVASLGRGPQLDLILLQVKNSGSLGESAIDKLIVHLPILLDFSRNDSELASKFNPRLLEITRRFLDVYRSMDMPELRIFVAFVALKAADIHPNVQEKTAQLRGVLKTCFGNSESEVHLIDAATMADMARVKRPTTAELTLAENPISTDMTGGYVGLVKLYDYQDFITDETGKLNAQLFDANVRDYEAASTVNEAIQETLSQEDQDVDFWWLNNGVTIVADKVQPAGKLLKLDSPQIVNGLQTSHEIFKRGIANGYEEKRGVLVKVIQADNDLVQDRIIRATNSQTLLGISSLRATDRVQREIEEYLKSRGFYYERRKNFYRNQQISLNKLVSIDQLGQAILATLVQAPHVSRGEVSRIFDDEVYQVVFDSGNPISAYYSSVLILRDCEKYLRDNRETRGQVDDFVFHLSMAAAVALTRKRQPNAVDLSKIKEGPSSALLAELIDYIRESFAAVARAKKEVLFERISKDPDATQAIIERLNRFLASSRRTQN